MNNKQLAGLNLGALGALAIGWVALALLDREGFPAWPFFTLLLVALGMVTYVAYRLQGAAVAIGVTVVWLAWFALSMLSASLFNVRFPTRFAHPMPELVAFVALFAWNAWSLSRGRVRQANA